MVSKIRIFVHLLCFLFLFHSCVTDITNEFPIEKSIVLNGLLTPGDTIKVTLTRSGLDTDSANSYFVKDATVYLYLANKLVDTLTYLENGQYISSYITQELTQYRIKVKSTKNEIVWAETFVPEKEFDANIYTPYDQDSLLDTWPFYLELKDHPSYDNHYWLCDLQYYFNPDSTFKYQISYMLISASPYIDQFNMTYDPEGGKYCFDYSMFMYLCDVDFQGETINIEFIPSSGSTLKRDSIILYNMDEHYSNYLKSKIINEEGGNYLTENGPPISYQPAFLYTNVHGGMGILGSYTTYTKTYQYK